MRANVIVNVSVNLRAKLGVRSRSVTGVQSERESKLSVDLTAKMNWR